MIKVYGCSDDLVEVEGAPYPADEIGCFGKDVQIWFADGTEIRVGYPKKEGAIWWIDVVENGNAGCLLKRCHDEDAEIYSDIFTIDSEYVKHKVVEKSSEEG